MKRASIIVAALSTLMGVTAIIPAQAMPLAAQPQSANRSTDVQQARVVIKYGYWRGHRGYRYARPGYRRYRDGFWYPAIAFGPTIVVKPRRHWYWCGPRHNRHRCYR